MSGTEYATELDRIDDVELRADLDQAIGANARIPTGPLKLWALKYARWRAGDRPLYPVPPSAKVAIEGIELVEAIVNALVPFRQRRGRIDEDVVPRDFTRRRTADWNPTR